MTAEYKWLNDTLIEKIVCNHLKLVPEQFQVRSYKNERASADGDNFLGTLVRVTVTIVLEGVERSLNYIVKAGAEGALDGVANAFNVYAKEKEMYAKVVPGMQQILDEASIDITLGPGCYYSDETIIVLEDLKPRGFVMKDKSEGLDFEHASKALENLAAWHAASLAYEAKNGPFGEFYAKGMFNEAVYDGPEGFKPYYQGQVEGLRLAVNAWEGFGEEAARINSWDPDVYLKTCAALEPQPDGFNVLCHGDMWNNNVMFKYEDEALDSCILIDFQLSFWSSPAKDLWYFICNSVQDELKAERFDDFLQVYHSHLVRFLKALKLADRTPLLKDIHIELLKKSSVVCMMLAEGLPMMLAEKGFVLDIDLLSSGTDEGKAYRDSMFAQPRFVRVAKKFIKFLYKRGALDL